jgi:4-amino-4-deoxy-L-arabinose transferase-like glycosyltransferase
LVSSFLHSQRGLPSLFNNIPLALIVARIPLVFFHSIDALDDLWWVLAAYGVIRLLRTDNPRWWLMIGAALGLGMMTKYTMIFFIA